MESTAETKKSQNTIEKSKKIKTNSPKEIYDIIVIGAGSGGLSVGLSMHQLGFDVLLIDKSDRAIGGECLNTGCVPSKALIHVSRLVHSAKKAENFGLAVEGNIDMKKVKQYVDEKREIIREHENADYFENQGIDVALGTARFVSKDIVEVGNKLFRGRKFIIATGSKPRKLKVPGVELVKYYDNESIFDLEHLPKKLLLVGGGPIGMELGQAFQRLGAEVSVVHHNDMIMTKEDPEIAALLKKRLEEEGIKFYLNAEIKKFNNANEAVVEVNNKEEIINFDAVLVGIGRVLDFKPLELENADIEVEDGEIKTDGYLRTTNKRVFLSGDVAGYLKFSHGAELHATLLLNNFFSPLRKKLNFESFPWVTFTDPEVATFGLGEHKLKERGIKFEKRVLEFKEDDRAVVGDYRYGKLILFFEKSLLFPGNSKILGGSMIAPHAGEITQELVLANSAGIKSSELFNKIYAYPTSARVNKTMMVNRYNDFLSPFIKKMLHMIYRFW